MVNRVTENQTMIVLTQDSNDRLEELDECGHIESYEKTPEQSRTFKKRMTSSDFEGQLLINVLQASDIGRAAIRHNMKRSIVRSLGS